MCTFVFMGDWRILGRGNTGAEGILLFVVIPEAAERLSGVSGVGDPGSSLRCGRGDGVGSWWPATLRVGGFRALAGASPPRRLLRGCNGCGRPASGRWGVGVWWSS